MTEASEFLAPGDGRDVPVLFNRPPTPAPGLLMIRMAWELQASGFLPGGTFSNDLAEKLPPKRYQFFTLPGTKNNNSS